MPYFLGREVAMIPGGQVFPYLAQLEQCLFSPGALKECEGWQ